MNDLDTLPVHLRKPDLRPVQPIQVVREGQQLIALRDPVMLSGQTMLVPPHALAVLQQFRGTRAIEEIAAQFNGEVDQFVELARGLDRVGLLWGPTFESMEKQARERIAGRGSFPATAAASLGDDADACRARLDGWFAETDDPELDLEVGAIVAPHLDYERGWPNYAAAYWLLREQPAPDRVVVLGTNHHGIGDGVVLTEYGFETALGTSPADGAVVDAVVRALGSGVIVDQLDHLGEHSIQLQVPWIQHCFGTVPIVAALVPDPLASMITDDGARVDGVAFADGLRSALDAAGGRTLVVASSDLSHVGPQFGEPRPVDDQRRTEVEQHDRDMLGRYLDGDVEAFVGAFTWNRNPTRWCSIGNMAAALRIAAPSSIELVDYRQAFDERGIAMVSSAAMVMG